MAKLKIPGSIKRFGARYGKTIKDKVAFIEKDQRSLHKCPKCHATKVKRIVVGIWQCKKCNNKFAGKAYNPGRRPKFTGEAILIKEESPAETKREEASSEE